MPEDLDTGAVTLSPAAMVKAYHQFVRALVHLAPEAAEQPHGDLADGATHTHREIAEVPQQIIEAVISALSRPPERSPASSRRSYAP